MNPDKIRFYAELEEKLRSLLEDLKTNFSESQVAEVIQFLDAGEYGIAFESFCTFIDERKLPVTRQQFDQIDACASAMQIATSWWQHLRPA